MCNAAVLGMLISLVISGSLQMYFVYAQDDPQYQPSCKMYNYTIYKCYFGILQFLPALPEKIITKIEISRNNIGVVPANSFYDHPELMEIDLSINDIIQIEGLAFSGLRKLTGLKLFRNYISSIPTDAFQGLISLRVLQLQENWLNDIGLAFNSGLRNLAELWLFSNFIHLIPADAFQGLISLRVLQLQRNMLYDIPHAALSMLPSLTTLYIGSDQYCEFTTEHLTTPLINMKLLQLSDPMLYHTLHLSNSSFKQIPYLSELIIEHDKIHADYGTFEPLKQLKLLSTGCIELTALQSVSVTVLDLTIDCSRVIDDTEIMLITIASAQSLKYLDRLEALETLKLIQNISSIEEAAFTSVRTRHRKNLKTQTQHIHSGAFVNLVKLDLSSNVIGRIESGAFIGLSSLKILDLSWNLLVAIPAHAFQMFSEAIPVAHIDLSHNKIHSIAGNYTYPFGTSPNLTELYLDGNYLGSDFVQSQLNLPHLITLSLHIEDFDNIRHFPNLRNLYVTYSSVTPEIAGTEMIPATLRHLEIDFKGGGKNLYVDVMGIDELKMFGGVNDCFFGILEVDNISSLSLTSLEFSNTCSFTLYSDLPNLSKLIITHQQHMEELPFNFFKVSPNIEHLDLSDNSLKELSIQTMIPLTKLKYFNLRNNQLDYMTFVMPLMLTLNYLDLSGNRLTKIPVETFQNASKLGSNLQHLDLSDNPFDCTCFSGVTNFITWVKTDNIVDLGDVGKYVCKNPPNLIGTVITNVELDCVQDITILKYKPNLPLILGTSIPIVAIVTVIVFISIKWQWKIRYKLFQLQHRQRHQDYIDENDLDNFVADNIGEEDDDGDSDEEAARPLRFDAYVAYHDDDQNWVLDEMIKNIEGEYLNEEGELVQNDEQEQRMVLHIPERDTEPGQPRIRAVTDAIQRSTKTILVLSQSFMACEWCYFQMQVAFERLFAEGRDVIILVLLEDIPYQQMTRELRKLLRRKRCLKWPDDPLGRRLFWGRLREKIKKPALVDRRFEI